MKFNCESIAFLKFNKNYMTIFIKNMSEFRHLTASNTQKAPQLNLIKLPSHQIVPQY